MPVLATLRLSRPVLAAFAAMGVLWGAFAAVLPDLLAMLNVDEARLGLVILFTPIAAVGAMLRAPRIGAARGGIALPVTTLAMACAFALPGQAQDLWVFPLAMICGGAATGLTDVLMNARVSELEITHRLHLLNLCHAAYSIGYAGGALVTGALRSLGWSPAWVMGIGASVIAPTAFSLVGGLAQPDARARAVARATLWGYFGYFFGPPQLGFIAGTFGLRMAFVFAAAILLGVLALLPIMARSQSA